MKNLIFSSALLLTFSVLKAQLNNPSLNIIRVDAQQAAIMLTFPALEKPTDSDFIIKDNKVLARIWDGVSYWDDIFDGYKKTLIIYPNTKKSSGIDSVLITENEASKFSFINTEKGWLSTQCSIGDETFTFNYVRVGLTSKELFKMLKVKIAKTVDNGQVWLENTDGTAKLVLIFSNDKVVEMIFHKNRS